MKSLIRVQCTSEVAKSQWVPKASAAAIADVTRNLHGKTSLSRYTLGGGRGEG